MINQTQESQEILEKLAECLHSHLCRHNHIDGCGWYYSNWEDASLSPYSSRYEYLERAKKVLMFLELKNISSSDFVEAFKLAIGKKI